MSIYYFDPSYRVYSVHRPTSTSTNPNQLSLNLSFYRVIAGFQGQLNESSGCVVYTTDQADSAGRLLLDPDLTFKAFIAGDYTRPKYRPGVLVNRLVAVRLPLHFLDLSQTLDDQEICNLKLERVVDGSLRQQMWQGQHYSIKVVRGDRAIVGALSSLLQRS